MTTPTEPDLGFWRGKIDEADSKILELLDQRMGFAKEIAKYKKAHEIPVVNTERWLQVIENLTTQTLSLDIDIEMVKEIWNTIHKYTIEAEENI
jgi:chorismate mutase